jgi:hypothetical protein
MRRAVCSKIALPRAAALIAVLAAATIAAGIAHAADAGVKVHAKLSRSGDRPLLQLAGTIDRRKTDRYAITGSLRAIPCPGTYRLVVSNSGPGRVSYEATFTLARSGGTRLRCGAELPGNLGRKFARLHMYGKGATAAESLITVSARRTGDTAIKGTFTTSELPCDRAYQLRLQLSSPSKTVTVMYDMRMKKASLAGRPCQ